MRNRRSATRSPASRALQRGMSLIEIIIVIVLIGVILAFVLSRVGGASDRGKAKIARMQVDALVHAVEDYRSDTGALPSTLGDLVAQPQGATGWMGPYTKPDQLKDPWGNPIQYTTPGENGQPYDLVGLGKDGKPGGTSVDSDIRGSQ